MIFKLTASWNREQYLNSTSASSNCLRNDFIIIWCKLDLAAEHEQRKVVCHHFHYDCNSSRWKKACANRCSQITVNSNVSCVAEKAWWLAWQMYFSHVDLMIDLIECAQDKINTKSMWRMYEYWWNTSYSVETFTVIWADESWTTSVWWIKVE